jgi:hypothetical protein
MADDRDEDDADRDRDEDAGGFSLSLPPITLPPLFPEDFRVLWPVSGDRPRTPVSARAVLAALAFFDVADAVLALADAGGALAAVRVASGAVVAGVAFGTLGVAYVWEAAAVLAGHGELTAVPTLTVLFVARYWAQR